VFTFIRPIWYAGSMILWIVFCRVFQFFFGLGARLLPWRKAERVQGKGSLGKIPSLLEKMGARKPLLVSDPGLRKAGLVQKVTVLLEGAGIPFALWTEVEANPTVDTVQAIHGYFIAEHCDAFIALGGGSAIDASKGAAALVARPGKSLQAMAGLFRVLRRLPPFIAIPTTAGTGSETTVAALITDPTTHHKYAIMDLVLMPRYAVLDPELTASLPPAITSTTGMDALTHAVESYLNWSYPTGETRRFCLEAVKAIFGNLEQVYRNGGDLEARLAMMEASFKAGFAFTRSCVGNVHAIAHTLGGLYNTPHGLANAVILPIVLEDYGSKVHRKLARLAEAAGIQGDSNQEKARAFIQRIYDMNERLGIPRSLDFIKEEDIEKMITWALKECNPLYPVPVIYSRDRCRRVIEKVRTPGFLSGRGT